MHRRCCCARERQTARLQLIFDLVPQRGAVQRVLDLFVEVPLIAVEAQAKRDIVEDAHREGVRLLKYHPDVPPNDDGIDAGVIDVLTEEVDVTLEPEARHHVVHPIEAAQYGALAASGGADKAGDRSFRDRDAAVAHREEVAIVDFADVAVDRYW